MPKIEAGLPNGSEVGAPPGAAAAAAAAVAAATTQVKAEPTMELGGAQGLKMDQVFALFMKPATSLAILCYFSTITLLLGFSVFYNNLG